MAMTSRFEKIVNYPYMSDHTQIHSHVCSPHSSTMKTQVAYPAIPMRTNGMIRAVQMLAALGSRIALAIRVSHRRASSKAILLNNSTL